MVVLFDLLPAELIRDIFRYLWAHEILHSFFQLSDYLDNVLRNYDHYAVKLGSLTKNQFNLTCEIIQSRGIKSITIESENDTPDQVKLFFSRFPAESLINLHSFALQRFEEDPIPQEMISLCRTKRFRSFCLQSISHIHWCLFASIIEPIIYQSRVLCIDPSLIEKPCEDLRHLNAMHYFCHRFPDIFTRTLNLRSFCGIISLDNFPWWSKKLPVMKYLRRLSLKVSCKCSIYVC